MASRNLAVVLAASFLLIAGAAGLAQAAYSIPNDVIGSAGAPMSSASYQMNSTLGQPSPLGAASSLSYDNYPGFWQADECVYDPDNDGLTNAVEYGYLTLTYNPDTDGDNLDDGEEVEKGDDGYFTDPIDPYSDSDTLNDGEEMFYGTNPNDPDTDSDNLDDGIEVAEALDPLYWDTDWDGMPDGYEYNDVSLNPGASVDGGQDFDGDGNPNAHEYYNGTDMWDDDPVGHFAVEAGNLGCAYWGDADGVCIITSPDLSMLRNAVARAPVYYGEVIPSNGQTQDLDRDDNIGAPDISWMRNFVARAPVGGIPSRSDRLVIFEMPGDTLNPAEIEVGSICEIKLGVLAEHSSHEKFVPGFAVHFSIDPASAGDATIFGGDGDRDGVRYDISGDYTEFSPAQVTLRIDEPGQIILNAEIPACGQSGTGRSADQVILSPAIIINGTSN